MSGFLGITMKSRFFAFLTNSWTFFYQFFAAFILINSHGRKFAKLKVWTLKKSFFFFIKMSDDEDVPFLIKKCIRYALDDYQLFVYNFWKKVRPNIVNFMAANSWNQLNKLYKYLILDIGKVHFIKIMKHLANLTWIL